MPAQQCDAVRNLLRLPDAAIGVHARERLERLLRLVPHEELRARRARGDGVDADALAAQVLRHHADHLFDGAFGREVRQVRRHDGRGGREGGGDEDHVRAGGHVGGCFLDGC